jgi:hypothetical protein
MRLGRADLAWNWQDAVNSDESNRQLRDAALLTLLANQSGQSQRLIAASRILDFLVGRANATGIESLQTALKSTQIVDKSSLLAARVPMPFANSRFEQSQ